MTRKLRINTKKGLEQLLQIIAEESVGRARLAVSSEDERMKQTDMSVGLGKLKKHQTPEAAEIQDEDDDDDLFADDEPQKGEKEPEKEPAEKPAAKSAEAKITFTMIKDKVNTIRSGRSLRDQEIRQELKDYFNDLDDDEQSALFAFLDGIAQVLTAGIDGKDADEPSDPPHNVQMTSTNSDDEEEAHPRGNRKAKSSKNVKKRAPLSKKRGLEDTSPPIDVGKKQRTEAIRRHIRDLMG